MACALSRQRGAYLLLYWQSCLIAVVVHSLLLQGVMLSP